MMNFVWASLFLLHLALGNDEIAEEEISKFLYDYASHYSDYLYATAEYYTDNTTILPTMYTVYAYNEGVFRLAGITPAVPSAPALPPQPPAPPAMTHQRYKATQRSSTPFKHPLLSQINAFLPKAAAL